MTDTIRKIYEEFIARRFGCKDSKDPYFKQWKRRFEDGWEWQHSDYTGRLILQDIAPDVYPKDKDKFFYRVSNSSK